MIIDLERAAKKILMMVLSVSHLMKDISALISMVLMTVHVKTGVSCIRLDSANLYVLKICNST